MLSPLVLLLVTEPQVFHCAGDDQTVSDEGGGAGSSCRIRDDRRHLRRIEIEVVVIVFVFHNTIPFMRRGDACASPRYADLLGQCVGGGIHCQTSDTHRGHCPRYCTYKI